MSITIIEAGISDTIQDLGRYGFAHLGINPGGAMDKIAATVANYLVGNPAEEAVVELHFPASEIRFDAAVVMALSGADFSPMLNNAAIPVNTPVLVPAGSVLRFRGMKAGMRCYLAIAGGLELTRWLNSYSTNLKAKAGGYQGRRLQPGDRLEFRSAELQLHDLVPHVLNWHADVAPFYHDPGFLRVIPGNEYPLLDECAVTILDGNSFSIGLQSDRMGYRMNGTPLQLTIHKEMISSAVTMGTVQLLPNGQLIILMADHQTTGGYPRVAHVISADLPRLAQLRPNTQIRFQVTSTEEAMLALQHQGQQLQQLKNGCAFRLAQYLQQHAIY